MLCKFPLFLITSFLFQPAFLLLFLITSFLFHPACCQERPLNVHTFPPFKQATPKHGGIAERATRSSDLWLTVEKKLAKIGAINRDFLPNFWFLPNFCPRHQHRTTSGATILLRTQYFATSHLLLAISIPCFWNTSIYSLYLVLLWEKNRRKQAKNKEATQ